MSRIETFFLPGPAGRIECMLKRPDGDGGSGGAHDGGRGERDDLVTAIDHLSSLHPGRPLLLAGYSFGAYVALAVGCRDPRAAALIGIGLPVTLVSFDFLAACDRPLTLIQGGEDSFGPLPLVMALASRLPGGARVVAVPGASHDFAGRLDDLARRTAEAIPERLRPARPPGAPIGDDPSRVIS